MPDSESFFDLLALGIEGGPAAIRTASSGITSGRPPESRRKYAEANDPKGYITEILGWDLTPQQEEAIDFVMREDRALLPSANNVGKTFLLAGLAWYFYDAVASLPDPERDLEEQGCILLLPGPDHGTIFDTIYSQMLEHAERAEGLGNPMPGRRSDRRPSMRAGARWFCRALSPKKQTGKGVSHTSSGRHHQNMVALIEEGAGVEEQVWESAKGMCSGRGNKIISSFNPTEPSGPAYDRARSGEFKAFHLSALDHPNVKRRSVVVGGAIDHLKFDERVRIECDDRGPYPQNQPDTGRRDFVYALPGKKEEDAEGPRSDGFPGHPLALLHVFRPGSIFTAQGLGQWPTTSSSGLFDPSAWDEAVERWQAAPEPDTPPDRVGVDAARMGNDDTSCAPAWGKPAPDLLEAWREIQRATAGVKQRQYPGLPPMPKDVDEIADWLGSKAAAEKMLKPEEPKQVELKTSASEALENVRAKHRVRIGRLLTAPKGTGPEVGTWIAEQYPDSPFNVDEGGVGASVYDYLKDVLERDAMPVAFGSRPLPRIHNEPICEDLRTQMFVRAAELMRLGLLDVPPDPMLRQEAMAHRLEHRQRPVTMDGVKKVRPTVRLIAKDKVREEIGRSPDRMDALVMALLPVELVSWEM